MPALPSSRAASLHFVKMKRSVGQALPCPALHRLTLLPHRLVAENGALVPGRGWNKRWKMVRAGRPGHREENGDPAGLLHAVLPKVDKNSHHYTSVQRVAEPGNLLSALSSMQAEVGNTIVGIFAYSCGNTVSVSGVRRRTRSGTLFFLGCLFLFPSPRLLLRRGHGRGHGPAQCNSNRS